MLATLVTTASAIVVEPFSVCRSLPAEPRVVSELPDGLGEPSERVPGAPVDASSISYLLRSFD
jgi:hypothetical protein